MGEELVHEMCYHTQTKIFGLIDVLFVLFHFLYYIEVHTLQVLVHRHMIFLVQKV